MTTQTTKPDIFEQLRLALAILSNRHTLFLTEYEQWLLQLESDYESWDEIKKAAEEIMFELISSVLPQPEVKLDPHAIAADFLRQIEEAGGRLPVARIRLPSEWLAKMEEERLIRRSMNGVVFGPDARQFMLDFEARQAEQMERTEPTEQEDLHG